MSEMVYKVIAVFVIMAALCRLSFLYGKMQVKIEIVEKEVEVVRIETKEICRIAAQPNLDDDDIGRLFAAGRL